MKAGRIGRVLPSVLACIILSLPLVGCQMAREKSERASKDWSRGQSIGKAAISGRVDLTTDAAGENAYLVWVAAHEEENVELLRFARLDRAARVITERELRIGTNTPSEVEIVVDRRDTLHLTWTDRLGDERRLFYTSLDSMGRLNAYPKPVSLPGVSVDKYAMAINAEDEIDLFWGAREGEGAGLYHLRLDIWGKVTGENLHLGRSGFDPAFRTDRSGTTHLAWQEEPRYGEYQLYYATFDGQSRTLGQPTKLASYPVRPGVVAHRPRLGFAGGDVYIFWSSEVRGGGLTRPAAQSFYLVFPLGRPQLAGEPREVILPSLNRPEYARIQSLYPVRELARSAAGASPSRFIYSASTVQTHRDELATAFAVQLQGRTRTIVQIILALWSDGEIKGYQIVGKTSSASLRPRLVIDGHDDLHLAWIDTSGFGAYDVYYASTTAEARANVNRITSQDVLAFAARLMWAFIQALGFFPLAFAWLVVPVSVISIYLFIRAEGDLARLGSRIMLVVAMLIYLGFKYLTGRFWLGVFELPGLSTEVLYLFYLVAPLVIWGLAAVATWVYVRSREFASLFQAFAVFAAFDAIITLIVYIPGIMVE